MKRHRTDVPLSIAFAALSLFSVGCSPRPPQPRLETRQDQPAPPQPQAQKPTSREDVSSPTTGSIRIDERIVAACGNLPVPHFPFDSAAITGPAADTLRVVANCFIDGPLRGKSLKLVGRADPRGTPDYNLVLGQDRAASVARYLSTMGLRDTQISTMSRGAFDATGTDEEGWARDRRVDIRLAD